MPTLKIDGTLSFPIGSESNLSSRTFSAQLFYDERSLDDVSIPGAVVDQDLMSLIADAKACYIEVVSGEGELKINGSAPTLPISVDGGFWVWFNPNGGLTALSITTAAAAKLRVYMFT